VSPGGMPRCEECIPILVLTLHVAVFNTVIWRYY